MHLRSLCLPVSLSCTLLLASCQKDKEESTLDLSGQVYTDVTGNVARINGATDDYRPESWEPWVYQLFSPLDTARLPAAAADSVYLFHAYPNPCRPVQNLPFRSFDSVNVKIVVVDKQRHAWLRSSVLRPAGNNLVPLNYTSFAGDVDSLYRCYVGFSTAGHPYFLKAHYDLTISP